MGIHIEHMWTLNIKKLELVLKNHLHKNFLTMQDVTIKTTNKQATTSTEITQSLIYGTYNALKRSILERKLGWLEALLGTFSWKKCFLLDFVQITSNSKNLLFMHWFQTSSWSWTEKSSTRNAFAARNVRFS